MSLIATHKPTLLYRAIAVLISPLWLLYTVIRTAKDGGRSYLLQRLGFYTADKVDRIWIHAASVGEVNTVLPLLQALQASPNAQPILVTTTTPTGKQTLLKQLPDNCIHRYLPVDLGGACKRFLSQHQLRTAWVMETEIWPWLFARSRSANLPLTIINARMTAKTLRAKDGVLADTFSNALNGINVMAKDELEAERYETLSTGGANVVSVGNLKYAARNAAQSTSRLMEGRYCVAASTHDNEELQLAKAWLDSKPNSTLVIVPRHPERGAAIKKALSEFADVPLRSNSEEPNDSRLYIADTLGELADWFSFAEAVFMGGSLIERGGHNLLEPARMAKLIVTGPSMFNFKDETALLESSNAVLRASSADDVVSFLNRAVEQPDWAKQYGEKAKQAVNTNAQVTQDYLALLLP